jgi:hypothetical protein
MPQAVMMMINAYKTINLFLFLRPKALFPAFLLYLNIIAIQQSQGQQNDFQFWPSVQVNLEVIENFRFHMEEELRFQENALQIGRQINDMGISYRLNKHMKTALFYRFEADWKNADEYDWRKGFYGDFTFKIEPRRLSLGYRLRLQSSRTEINEEQPITSGGFRHRHKISAAYNIKGLPLSPFAESELFIDYIAGKGSGLSGIRSWLGLDYAIGKQHGITLKYGIDQEFNVADPLRAYILAVDYSLNLKLKSAK